MIHVHDVWWCTVPGTVLCTEYYDISCVQYGLLATVGTAHSKSVSEVVEQLMGSEAGSAGGHVFKETRRRVVLRRGGGRRADEAGEAVEVAYLKTIHMYSWTGYR